MSARNYMPYIEGAMDYIKEIYRWNEEVDMMRIKKAISQQKDAHRGVTLPKVDTMEDYHKYKGYDFNAGLRLLYEERGEYTTGKLKDNIVDQVDAIVDQFVVAIGEIRKCALADDYEHIEFWEEKAIRSFDRLHDRLWDFEGLTDNIKFNISNATNAADEKRDKCLTEVISKLFTRLGGDSYIDENGKFKKRSDFQEPDLSFLLK